MSQAVRAKYRVRPDWLIKRLSCRLCLFDFFFFFFFLNFYPAAEIKLNMLCNTHLRIKADNIKGRKKKETSK